MTTITPPLFYEVAAKLHELIEHDEEVALPPVELYNVLYAYVYNCCIEGCASELHVYKLAKDIAATHPLPKGRGRDVFVNFWAHVFKYLDRIYVQRLLLSPVKEAMIENMNDSIADAHKVKCAFRFWLLNTW